MYRYMVEWMIPGQYVYEAGRWVSSGRPDADAMTLRQARVYKQYCRERRLYCRLWRVKR